MLADACAIEYSYSTSHDSASCTPVATLAATTNATTVPRLSDDAITKHRLEGITGKLREIVAARQPYATDDPPMEKRYSILDRLKASDGYSTANTRLLCARHDMEAQQAKNYTETGGYVRHDGDP